MSPPVIHVTALYFLLWNWAGRDSKPESSQHWSPCESERTVRKRRQWALWCQSDLWCQNLSVDALTCANNKKRTTQISVIWCQSVVYTRCNLQVTVYRSKPKTGFKSGRCHIQDHLPLVFGSLSGNPVSTPSSFIFLPTFSFPPSCHTGLGLKCTAVNPLSDK